MKPPFKPQVCAWIDKPWIKNKIEVHESVEALGYYEPGELCKQEVTLEHFVALTKWINEFIDPHDPDRHTYRPIGFKTSNQ